MAQPVFESLIQQPVFRTYLFYVAVLSLKMLLMSVLTAIQRFKNKVRITVFVRHTNMKGL